MTSRRFIEVWFNWGKAKVRDRSKSSLPCRLSATFVEKDYNLAGEIMFLLLSITIWFIPFTLLSLFGYHLWQLGDSTRHPGWSCDEAESCYWIRSVVRSYDVLWECVGTQFSSQSAYSPSQRAFKEDDHSTVGTSVLFWIFFQ